jgi:pyridoxamine 5'-phosphate oxidase
MEVRKENDTRSNELARLRREYLVKGLNENDLDQDPIKQFQRWLDEAMKTPLLEPTAMTLATSGKDGKPSARMVLLKNVDARGFVFFTNYESRKGKELLQNPQAALLFFWDALERQVRVEGMVERTTEEESQKYFNQRPFASRIAATISHQSSVVASRDELEKKFHELAAKLKDNDVPVPKFWGGFRVVPRVFEFWQGRENRLHDRFRYAKQDGRWVIQRLSP